MRTSIRTNSVLALAVCVALIVLTQIGCSTVPMARQPIVIQYPQKQFDNDRDSDLYRSGWTECWLEFGPGGGAPDCELLEHAPMFRSGHEDGQLMICEGFNDCRGQLLELRSKLSPQQLQELRVEVEENGMPMLFRDL